MNKQKISLFLAATAVSISSWAQIEKGTDIMGGRSSFSTNSSSVSSPLGSTDSKGTSFSIEPQYGYYLSKNWAILLGFNLGISNATQNNFNSVTNDFDKRKIQRNNFGFNVQTRYNKALSKRFAFFLQGTLGANISGKEKTTIEQKIGPTISKNTMVNVGKFGESPNFNLDIRPGVIYFVTPKLGIEATFASVYASFSSTKATAANQNTKASAFNLGYNLYPAGFSLGVNYYITPKPKPQTQEEE